MQMPYETICSHIIICSHLHLALEHGGTWILQKNSSNFFVRQNSADLPSLSKQLQGLHQAVPTKSSHIGWFLLLKIEFKKNKKNKGMGKARLLQESLLSVPAVMLGRS